MTGAQVEASVVGQGALVCQGCGIRNCVLYPEAVASQHFLQLSVLGRRAVTTLGSLTMDLNFERDIRVPLDGAMHSVGARLLGAAFGHDCTIGTGIWMASGRSVPNGAFVVRDPDQVLSKVPEQVSGGPQRVRGGRLERIGDATVEPGEE